jgi:hypothetical protein
MSIYNPRLEQGIHFTVHHTGMEYIARIMHAPAMIADVEPHGWQYLMPPRCCATRLDPMPWIPSPIWAQSY